MRLLYYLISYHKISKNTLWDCLILYFSRQSQIKALPNHLGQGAKVWRGQKIFRALPIQSQ